MVARYTKRVQIMLRPEQHDQLKQLAAARETEVSPLLRDVVEDYLDQQRSAGAAPGQQEWEW